MSNSTLPKWLKPMNKVVIAIHKLGVVTGPVRVLTITGRSSGQPRSTPATPFPVGDALYVVGGLPGAH